MIDFHIHSRISDGSEAPSHVVHLAKEKALRAMSLTDHDAIEGLEEARQAAKDLGMTFVNGIELSVAYGQGRLIHVLGLDFDPETKAFQKAYKTFRQGKEVQIPNLIKAMAGQGITLKESDLYDFATGDYLDRQAITKWLVHQGITENISRAWMDVLDLIPYFPGELIDPIPAIDMIKAAGGKTYIAHYHKNIGLKGYSHRGKMNHLKALTDIGLDGIEAYYPSFSQENYHEIGEFVEVLDLQVSGGTDFHGTNRAHIQIGTGNGHFEVPDVVYDKLKAL